MLPIINIGRTLILELPPKQNTHPIGYITLLALTSQLKCRLPTYELNYGLVPMEKLAELLMGVRNTGKAQSEKWQNRDLFLFLSLTKCLRSHNSVVVVGTSLK